MAEEEKSNGAAPSPEGEVWSAITAFEQILEAMPEDRSSLEALSHAYAQIGDHARAKDYLVRLTRVILNEGDSAAAADLLEKLRPYVNDDAEVRELVESIQQISTESPALEAPVSAPAAAPAAPVRMAFRMADELSFAWNLHEAGQITQDEYAQVVQDLSEMSVGNSETTISLLHVLQGRAFKNLEQIIGYAAGQCGTPIVSLANFEVQYQACRLLPVKFMIARGALPFDLLGSHALVVVLNPYDKQLREDVQVLAGCPCDFFVTLPSDFDLGLERVKSLTAEAEIEGKA